MKERCATKYCRNKPKGRTYCSTCRSRQSRKNNPVRASFNNLRSNAKRRRKSFTLTFDEFAKFCVETDYITGARKSKTSYSIDRKRNEDGYNLDNIRVLTLSDNSKKGTKSLQYDWQTGYATVVNSRHKYIGETPF